MSEAMPIVEKVKTIIEGTKSAVSTVIPFPMTADNPEWIKAPINQKEIGVLVSVTGDLKVRLILEESKEVFQRMGEQMYGMPLEDEILESFVGEMGNMIAGNLAAYLSEKGYQIDITPPTVMVGQTKIYGFDRAIYLPLHIEGIGQLHITLIVEQD